MNISVSATVKIQLTGIKSCSDENKTFMERDQVKTKT